MRKPEEVSPRFAKVPVAEQLLGPPLRCYRERICPEQEALELARMRASAVAACALGVWMAVEEGEVAAKAADHFGPKRDDPTVCQDRQ